MNRKRDLYLIAETYSKMGFKPDYDYDDELQLKPKDAERLGINPKETFYAQANYNKEDYYDEGDGRWTPPSSWVKTGIEDDPLFYRENPETGDIDIPIKKEEEPELYKALFDALDEKIYEFEAER
jgi:hypothetical protein